MKLGGLSAPTQDVSGASGAARNETITAWAQGDAGETKCPTPGMLMIVALDRLVAAAFAVRWSEGEAREPLEWRHAARIVATHRDRPRPKVILSGGLTPENVGRAVALVKPYAVDVNSGVEARPGTKDPDKVRRFVAAAKSTAREGA